MHGIWVGGEVGSLEETMVMEEGLPSGSRDREVAFAGWCRWTPLDREVSSRNLERRSGSLGFPHQLVHWR